MNGELIINGYKFSEKLTLNLLDKTIITGEDAFIAFELFNMLEHYFVKKSFSNLYLDNNTVLILNGNKLSGDEFIVFRLHPIVNLSEEIKLSKKSMMGQIVALLLAENNERIQPVIEYINKNVIKPLNDITERYGVSFVFDEEDSFAITKIFRPVVTEKCGQDILIKEHDQFYCKAMLLDFFVKLKVNKKKMFLVELPEYGLRENEILEFFKLLLDASLDNIIIYTNTTIISEIFSEIYNYNVVKKSKIYGFDDYDELEKRLEHLCINISKKQLERKIIQYILNSNSYYNNYYKDEFFKIIDDFMS